MKSLMLLTLIAPSFLGADVVPHEDTEIACLAQNIYHEARGEPVQGQLAVGLVTMNRTKHRDFPDSVCDVVAQKRQFSWVGKKNIKIDLDSMNKILPMALRIYKNEVNDITRGATHFHASYIEPSWTKVTNVTVVIGNHVFRKKKNETKRNSTTTSRI